jgi:hypothetical protein
MVHNGQAAGFAGGKQHFLRLGVRRGQHRNLELGHAILPGSLPAHNHGL